MVLGPERSVYRRRISVEQRGRTHRLPFFATGVKDVLELPSRPSWSSWNVRDQALQHQSHWAAASS